MKNPKDAHPTVRDRFSRMRRTVVLATPPPKALTQQQFKDECDMNRIVANARRGIAPVYTAKGAPHYGDFSDVPDLHEAYDIVERAHEAFMTLPSGLRGELNNDPANIGQITQDQIDRYKLGRALPTPGLDAPAPSQPAPSAAVQAASPASGSETPKASKKSSSVE